MIIKHISDTHGSHDTLDLEDLSCVDVLVHTGDATNHRNPLFNEEEFYKFIDWYKRIYVEHKIYVSGNHDSFIYHNKKEARKALERENIIYLDKEDVTIDGVKFYGDPTSPNFGNWFFMADRSKMWKHWALIPDDVNVLLTHTPPRGILDLSYNRDGCLEFCGCMSLYKKCQELGLLKAVCYGHIHNSRQIQSNQGIYNKDGIQYSNAACVTDGQFDKGCTSHGNVLKIG